ncbi:hypothetical protein F6U93_06270 [Tamlana haliotis]|uniref:Serum amyloid A protein n=1 Tax=Pseudotamlana haliotis TaxID=2614804 RepID=A0A6N6MCE4_9FLAO|nr:hypothetical protein [Tamlana haliotis]KAB1068303.1 hypothetical protein F6U93_06270 [Tamlana haliotis]
MKQINYKEEQMNAFKLKMASLTYFTIFSSATSINTYNSARNHVDSKKGLGWSGRLEEALSNFQASGANYRNNPTDENNRRYRNAKGLYYEALLDKHDTIPKSVVSDTY